jgi:hypothetical protein
MATSDSLADIGPVLSGDTLMRFPTRRAEPTECKLSRTDEGLYGNLGFLSLHAATLYTVPAARGLVRCIPRRGRLRLQETGSPREKLQLYRFTSWWG